MKRTMVLKDQTSNMPGQNNSDLIQLSNDMIFTVDVEGNFTFTNNAFEKRLGFSSSEIENINGFELIHPDDLACVQEKFTALLEGESIEDLEYRYRTKDGSYITVMNNAVPIFGDNGDVVAALGIAREITMRKHAETVLDLRHSYLEKLVQERTAELEEANRQLKLELAKREYNEEALKQLTDQLQSFLETAPVIICRSDLKARVLYVNKKFEEVTGFSREEVVGKFWPSLGLVSVQNTRLLLKRMREKLMGKLPSPMEIKFKCKDGCLKYISGIGEVVKEKGKLTGFQVIAQDVTEFKQAQNERDESTRKLIRAMDGTIQALAMTVELRDLYTAGHQRRVAALAGAIAEEMGLSEDQSKGIHLAGLIHDIGKIRVPSEILTQPNGLSDAEFNIIKLHAVVGYELLQTIDFPWPIAKAVHQHHERLDGSGYPLGLSGDDIIIEAKILAVADVVEAMSSHRPYRQALGIDKALEEISGNRDILYDSTVVDVCLKLFEEKNFEFE